MKKMLTVFLCLTVLFGAEAFGISAAAQAKPSLAIRAFDNKAGGDAKAPASAITDMMTTELIKTGLFSLMEREKLDYVIDEILLGESGFMDPSTAPQRGNLIGAQYTMTGAITVYHYNAKGIVVPIPGLGGAGAAAKTGYVTLDIRIIDNTTGEVVYAAAETGSSNREVGGLVTRYGGFAGGSYGGILAAATRDSVIKHCRSMEDYYWE